MPRSPALLLLAAACAGGDVADDPRTVTLATCPGDEPTWVAIQDGNAPWQHVLPTGGGNTWTLSFSSDRGGIARVYASASGEYIDVSYASVDELVSLYGFFDNGSSCTPRTVTLSIAGVPSGSHAPTSVNGLGKDLINGPEAFEVFQPGTVDIVAARTDAGGDVDRIIVRKDVTVPTSGTVAPDLDFDVEGFAPAMMNMTITGLGAADTDVSLMMSWLPGGQHASLLWRGPLGSGATGTLPVPAVPASQAAADDWHQLGCFVTTSEGSRSAFLMFRAAGDRSIPLAPILAQPTVSAGSTAPHGPRVQLAMQPEYNQAIDARFSYEGGSIILYATARSLGYPSAWDLSMPDLTGVEGWQEAWNPPATAWQDWLVLAYGGTWPWFGSPTDGAVYRSASRSAGGSGALSLAPRLSPAPPRTLSAITSSRPHVLTTSRPP